MRGLYVSRYRLCPPRRHIIRCVFAVAGSVVLTGGVARANGAAGETWRRPDDSAHDQGRLRPLGRAMRSRLCSLNIDFADRCRVGRVLPVWSSRPARPSGTARAHASGNIAPRFNTIGGRQMSPESPGSSRSSAVGTVQGRDCGLRFAHRRRGSGPPHASHPPLVSSRCTR
jgi:hypothetical protein